MWAADEHNLDRGKLEIEFDLVAMYTQCSVQIVELKGLTNAISSHYYSPNNNNNDIQGEEGLLAHYTETWAPLSFHVPPDREPAATAVPVHASSQPTDYSQSTLSLGSEGHDWNFSRCAQKMKEAAHTTNHLNPQ